MQSAPGVRHKRRRAEMTISGPRRKKHARTAGERGILNFSPSPSSPSSPSLFPLPAGAVRRCELFEFTRGTNTRPIIYSGIFASPPLPSRVSFLPPFSREILGRFSGDSRKEDRHPRAHFLKNLWLLVALRTRCAPLSSFPVYACARVSIYTGS